MRGWPFKADMRKYPMVLVRMIHTASDHDDGDDDDDDIHELSSYQPYMLLAVCDRRGYRVLMGKTSSVMIHHHTLEMTMIITIRIVIITITATGNTTTTIAETPPHK